MTVSHDGLSVGWLGYACLRLEGAETVVYTDPGRYGTLTGEWAEQYGQLSHPSGPAYDARDADVVLVTHDDHYEADGVRRVAAPDATLVVFEAVSAEGANADRGLDMPEPEDLPYDVVRVGYGDETTVDGVGVTVVPAYNHPDGPRAREDGSVSHPRGFGCGFVVDVDGTRCFWTGDTDVVEEQRDLEVSLFVPSIASNVTMGPGEAADLAEDLGPDLVLPIHYNTFPRLGADSRAFAADVASRGIPVVLDERDHPLVG